MNFFVPSLGFKKIKRTAIAQTRMRGLQELSMILFEKHSIQKLLDPFHALNFCHLILNFLGWPTRVELAPPASQTGVLPLHNGHRLAPAGEKVLLPTARSSHGL